MSYQVPQHIDPNKVFLINLSNIERRLDPEPYHNERINAINKIKQTSHYLPLSSIASFEKEITKNIRQGDKYLGLENISSEYGEYVETTEKESISSAAIFHKGDILFPKLRPYLNKVFFATFDGICSTEFYVLKSNSVNAEYLSIFLRSSLVVNQTKHLMTGNTLPRLQTEDVRDLLIPIPSIIIQQRIIDCYNAAYTQKLQKEEQAKALLQSIDEYLLSELGIQLPETKLQTIQDRMFVVNFSDASGERLDPMFYTSQFSNLVAKLHDSTTCKRLGQIAHFSSEIWNQRDYYEKEFPYIEIGAINITDGTIEDVSSVPIEQAPSRARVIVRTGDIIISTTRPDRGAIIKITENENLYIASTGFSVIRNINCNINPDYLLAILRHKLILMQMRQRSTGGNYPAITQEELSKIIIPILPIPKQQEIVNHISSIRQQAKALQEEGKAILEQAKKEVEQMILG